MQHVKEIIAELEWEIDTHRISFTQFLALGRDELAAREDRVIRDLTDELAQLYGREELRRYA